MNLAQGRFVMLAFLVAFDLVTRGLEQAPGLEVAMDWWLYVAVGGISALGGIFAALDSE